MQTDQLFTQFMGMAARTAGAVGDWREIPVGIMEFFTSKDYLNEHPHPGKQTELLLAIEHVLNKRGPTTPNEFKLIKEIVALFGKGAGKDFLISGVMAYIAYRLCCLNDPQKFFSFGQGEQIDLVNVALNSYQANNVFFKKLKSRLRNCKWFREVEYNPGERATAAPNEFQVTRNQIRFYKNITAHSTHSQAESFEGFNPLVVVFDEYGGFDAKTAKESYDIFYSSASTRYNENMLLMFISYPRHKRCPMMLKYDEAQHKDTEVWSIRGKSWEVNPNISQKELKRAYDKDPEKAKTMYECDPPDNVEGFYQFPEKVDQVAQKPLVVTTCEKIVTTRTTNNGKTLNFVGLNVMGLDNLSPEYTYYLGGDAGVTSDSYSLCLMRGVPTLTQVFEDGQPVEKFVNKPEEVLLLQWVPNKKDRLPVDLLNVADVLEDICRRVHVEKALFDKFNSAECIQRLQTYGVDAEDKNYSNPFQLSIHTALKTLIYTGFVTLIEDETANEELKHLKLINGNKIDHEEPYGKDLSDARATAAWLCHNAEVEDLKNYAMPIIMGATRA